MVTGVHIQFLPKALRGILRGYLIAPIVVSVRNTELETLILNFQLPQWSIPAANYTTQLLTNQSGIGSIRDTHLQLRSHNRIPSIP